MLILWRINSMKQLVSCYNSIIKQMNKLEVY